MIKDIACYIFYSRLERSSAVGLYKKLTVVVSIGKVLSEEQVKADLC